MAERPTSLESIHHKLGELSGDVKAILRQMELERSNAKESRRVIYERIEKVEEIATIAGKVAGLAKEKADTTSKIIVEEVKPQTDKLKALGVKTVGFLTGAGMVGGLAAQPAWAALVNAIDKLTK